MNPANSSNIDYGTVEQSRILQEDMNYCLPRWYNQIGNHLLFFSSLLCLLLGQSPVATHWSAIAL